MSSKFEGFTVVKEKLPYYGKGVEELLTSLKTILNNPDNKYAQKIVLEVGEPHIYLEKLIPSDGVSEAVNLSLMDNVRSKMIEEYEFDKEQPGFNHLWDIFSIVHKEGFEVGFIIIGNKATFQKWIGVRIPSTDMNLFGTPLQLVADLPEDVFIVCGTSQKEAEPHDVRFSVKGTIP